MKNIKKKAEPEQTIVDFGKQWKKYQTNEGYYASVELLSDIFGPLVNLNELQGAKVAEIGSGTGRIVNMLLACGVDTVTAIEPSKAYDVLLENTNHAKERVTCLQVTGNLLPTEENFDYILSIGVLHHIEKPLPCVQAAFSALKPGGRFLIWLYGKEGNTLYLVIATFFRAITTILPDSLLEILVRIIDWNLVVWMKLCQFFPLPLSQYMNGYLSKLSPANRRLTIFDQLNPAYAKYYTRQEALDLIKSGEFVDIKIYHRHGYSWTVIGTKPFSSP
ncbi:MAG: class I SAM-dependent methyltransferase [Symploca sp. SIO2D2]|nr:class I SAM-dependent methyltransferase [Symploca sp. SIO2D2]